MIILGNDIVLLKFAWNLCVYHNTNSVTCYCHCVVMTDIKYFWSLWCVYLHRVWETRLWSCEKWSTTTGFCKVSTQRKCTSFTVKHSIKPLKWLGIAALCTVQFCERLSCKNLLNILLTRSCFYGNEGHIVYTVTVMVVQPCHWTSFYGSL